MSPSQQKDWRQEFGLQERSAPAFFANKNDITPDISQGHMLRRAFDLLKLDGILCAESAPIIYFKQVAKITPVLAHDLHRRFWNHGGAPIMVLISDNQIQVYSGMSRPTQDSQDYPPGLVTTINVVSEGLRQFILSVESGEFFKVYARSFDPAQRIDRDLLNNLRDTRDALDEITRKEIAPQILDALLCRLVFTCYLFDREVIGQNYLTSIGLKNAAHLRDVLSLRPARDAKSGLYLLFQQLGRDFNGDLFNDDLEAEAKHVTQKHLEILDDFFHGTLVRSGQRSFWAYDFSAIPIETISAIYEHFLKSDDQENGAFYTPRFLAEVVLDTALENIGSLVGKTFFDPACGSGIFLVGLFNRIAEEWKQANPNARNDRRAKELMRLLTGSLFGGDVNPTACRITAFSLYLAYLDQLAPRDIQDLKDRGQTLPHLVSTSNNRTSTADNGSGNVRCIDFFADSLEREVDVVVGNPPWGSLATAGTPAHQWCATHKKLLPDFQIASAFIWKATQHISSSGRVCFVLPHGTLFNHNTTAVDFQKAWVSQNALDRVLNLADFRWFLFEKAVHPAIVVRFRKDPPAEPNSSISYWAPKVDWSATQAEIISVSPIDRSELLVRDILRDLEGPDAPQLWKQRLWGTPRDVRFLDRLSLFPRLRDHVRSSRDAEGSKPWLIAEGFQPLGPSDDKAKAQTLKLPSKYFIEAKSADLDLFLLQQDCDTLDSAEVKVRSRSNKNTTIFKGPHVLITKGFQRIAFADFSVSFRHALRGIHGPASDRDQLIFLTAYLRSSLAKYYMFHTTSSWGMYRPEGHVEEVLRLPLPLPAQTNDDKRQRVIVKEVAGIVSSLIEDRSLRVMGREAAILQATSKMEPLVDEYFGVHALERLLINDTIDITIPSIQPTRNRMPVPTVKHSLTTQRQAYTDRLSTTLNGWTKGANTVHGRAIASDLNGIGVVILKKGPHSTESTPDANTDLDVLQSLEHLRRIAGSSANAINPARGIVVFDKAKLFIVKPIGQRFWTQTAALNDADEIAGSLLMHSGGSPQ
jgi:type I restriction-modification system DNA methylase subunit